MNDRAGGVAFWGGLGLMLVIVALLIAGGTNDEPLDPRSVADDGAKGLVDLIESFGAEVTLGLSQPGPGADVALLLRDTYGLKGRDGLEGWVRAGGTLVVGDPTSPLTPRLVGANSPASGEGCSVPALGDVDNIVGTSGAFRMPPDGLLCYGGALAVDPVGEGTVVSIAGPGPLLNGQLADADNAVLTVSLLAPRPGTRVVFLEPRLIVGADAEALVDLIPDPAWVLLAQLSVAFLLYSWWRARRLGAPVPEPALVQIEGSELAAARGRLLEGLRQPASAAVELREDTRRQLLRRLGLPHEADIDVLAERVASLSQIAEHEVKALLETRPVANDADLRELSVGLAAIRTAVFPLSASVP